MKKKTKFSYILSDISLKCVICSLFSSTKQAEKKTFFREIVNCISYHRCLANYDLILVVKYIFFLAPPYDVLSTT